ncbi:MAG: hypothetical protein M1814_003095 [Vezdaea aestivalis]|nr:MAG: hypothetical protein M1814_003095 [Vezdaea aestivalis]
MAIVTRLVAKFNSAYASKPVLTMMVTNAVLAGIADTVAQTLTAVRRRQTARNLGHGKTDFISIEIQDLDRKTTTQVSEISTGRSLPPSFDFERMTRFMAFGFILAPVQFKWFQFLSKAFPSHPKTHATITTFKRVALDQLVMAPAGKCQTFNRDPPPQIRNTHPQTGLACFFTFMTIAEGGGRRAVARKFQEVYLPALKANYILWPAVQMLNLGIIPIQFQLPFVSTIGIAWTAYLSLTNSSDES